MDRIRRLIVLPMAGIIASLFFGISSANAQDEGLVSVLETLPLSCWDIYPYGHHKNVSYVTDCDTDRAEFIVIFSDGVVYAGKNKVRLNKQHMGRIRKLYKKVKKSKRRRCDKCYNTL